MQGEPEIVFPPFRLDLRVEKLWREEQEIALRPKTFAILRYLVQHPERLVSKAELLRAIWGEVQVSEEGLRDYIREIRKALSDNSTSPHFVETALGRGYRFVGRVASNQQLVVSRKEEGDNKQDPLKARSLLTVRGVYDGHVIKVLPTESLPPVSREVPVAILFLEDAAIANKEITSSECAVFIFRDTTTLNGHLKQSTGRRRMRGLLCLPSVQAC